MKMYNIELSRNLVPVYKQLSFAEKQQFVSLSRWFDHLQFLTTGEDSGSHTVISVNPLY